MHKLLPVWFKLGLQARLLAALGLILIIIGIIHPLVQTDRLRLRALIFRLSF